MKSVFIPIVIFVVYILVMYIRAIYIVARMPKEEEQHMLEVAKRYKRIKNLKKQAKHRGGSLHFLSYPTPLNRWGLWK